MTEENQVEAEATVEGKTEIKPDTTNYVKAKSASGSASMNNGDSVATVLQGMNIDEISTIAVALTGQEDLATRYTHLNVGQQRMNLGNRIRGAVSKFDKANEKLEADYAAAVAKFEADESGEVEEPTPLPEVLSGIERLMEVAQGSIESRGKRLAKAEEEAKAKAAEKEAKAKAKAEKEAAKAEEAEEADDAE